MNLGHSKFQEPSESSKFPSFAEASYYQRIIFLTGTGGNYFGIVQTAL